MQNILERIVQLARQEFHDRLRQPKASVEYFSVGLLMSLMLLTELYYTHTDTNTEDAQGRHSLWPEQPLQVWIQKSSEVKKGSTLCNVSWCVETKDYTGKVSHLYLHACYNGPYRVVQQHDASVLYGLYLFFLCRRRFCLWLFDGQLGIGQDRKSFLDFFFFFNFGIAEVLALRKTFCGHVLVLCA